MATKLDIVQQALGEIGLSAYVFNPSPAQLQAALVKLDRLAAEWDGIGIRKGYRIGGTLADESGLPDTAINGYACGLALALAPGYGKQVSPQLQVSATRSFNALMTTNNSIPQMPMPSRMPIGTGNRRDVLMPAYYTDQSTELVTDGDGDVIV